MSTDFLSRDTAIALDNVVVTEEEIAAIGVALLLGVRKTSLRPGAIEYHRAKLDIASEVSHSSDEEDLL